MPKHIRPSCTPNTPSLCFRGPHSPPERYQLNSSEPHKAISVFWQEPYGAKGPAVMFNVCKHPSYNTGKAGFRSGKDVAEAFYHDKLQLVFGALSSPGTRTLTTMTADSYFAQILTVVC